jgi:hypothetical protein
MLVEVAGPFANRGRVRTERRYSGELKRMSIRDPFLWGLCGLMLIVFAYCFFIGAMNQ